jgi:hypothetical protein
MAQCKLGRSAMGSDNTISQSGREETRSACLARHLTTRMAMSHYQRWSRPLDHPGQLTTEEHERGNHP